MSRRRKRIAAATLLMVSVLGLGLAGYIGATNASGKETTFANERYPSGFHRYRLNHQIGTGTSAYAWSESSEADAGQNMYAGSATPEDATTEKQADAETAGTSDAIGAGAGGGSEHAPAAPARGASGSNGEENWTPSSFRLAGSYGPGYRGTGGGGGGGSQGAVNQPGSNEQPNNEEPSSTQPTDETPTTTKPEDEKDPIDPVDPKGPTQPNGPGTPDYPPSDHPGDKPVSVPEPATLGLLGFGLAALGYMRRRRATAA